MTRSHVKTDTFNVKNLETDLPTQVIGRTVLVYDEVDSTNDSLKPVLTDLRYNGLHDINVGGRDARAESGSRNVTRVFSCRC